MPVEEIYHSFENLPKQVTEENMLGMRAGSSVADWALDECFFDPEVNNRMGQYEHGTGNSEHLYPAYRQWCEDTGRHKPVGSNIFKKRLFEVGTRLDYELSDSKNSKNQIIVLGVCLKSRATLFSKVPSCLLYTSPSPRDQRGSRMPSSA